MTNPTQTLAPERIELPNGVYWQQYKVQTHEGRLYLPDGQIKGPVSREFALGLAAAMNPAPSESDEADWQWLVDAVDEVSGETATVTRGDDTYRILIAELMEEDEKSRHRQPAAADAEALRERNALLEEYYQARKAYKEYEIGNGKGNLNQVVARCERAYEALATREAVKDIHHG